MKTRRWTVAAIAALVVVVAAACQPWPQFMGNPALTGDDSGEATITTANVATLAQAYEIPVNAGGQVFSPTVAGGKVYAAGYNSTGSHLVAGDGVTELLGCAEGLRAALDRRPRPLRRAVGPARLQRRGLRDLDVPGRPCDGDAGGVRRGRRHQLLRHPEGVHAALDRAAHERLGTERVRRTGVRRRRRRRPPGRVRCGRNDELLGIAEGVHAVVDRLGGLGWPCRRSPAARSTSRRSPSRSSPTTPPARRTARVARSCAPRCSPCPCRPGSPARCR